MPRPITEYTLTDWKRLRPLTYALKSWRYRWINRIYMGRRARVGDAATIARAIADRDVLVSVAFNDPEAISWQALLVRHYVPRAFYMVVDNSSDEAAATEIAVVAKRSRLPYLRLPSNPWRHPSSRSHGIALNWVWHNVLRSGSPRAFGFIDDDLFPTAPDDPFAPLNAQAVFGLVRQSGRRWFLWAGYCMFLFDAVQNKPLDFGQDWFVGLDTGGANWDVLYRHIERTKLKEITATFQSYKSGIAFHDGPIQWCGTWLHEIGSMGAQELAADKRNVVADILAPHLMAARSSLALQ